MLCAVALSCDEEELPLCVSVVASQSRLALDSPDFVHTACQEEWKGQPGCGMAAALRCLEDSTLCEPGDLQVLEEALIYQAQCLEQL